MKNKFQSVDFSSVTEFLHYLPADQLAIVESLRSLIFECIPDVKEKLSYNVPFYHRHKRICFIWPSSVNWGTTMRTGVDLGFCKGNLLADPGYLDIGNRKEVFVKTFHSVKEIDHHTIRQLLFEAVVIDEELGLKKNRPRLRPGR